MKHQQHKTDVRPKHNKWIRPILIFLFLFFSGEAKAGDHEEHHHGHENGSVEVGLSNSIVYTLGEQEFAYGLHVHSIYTFEESPFGLGLGYEMIFDEHQHQTAALVMCYRPTDPLALCLAPGALFEGTEVAFTTHVEATYEFEFHGLHLGPTVGFAYNPEDMHLSLGLHTGIQF